MVDLNMARLINPYLAGNPVRTDGAFFGRLSTLNWVNEVLTDRHTDFIVVFGQRRVGKTSFLLKLQRRLPEEVYIPVFYDMLPRMNLPLGEILAEIAEAIALKLDLPDPELSAFDDQGRYFINKFLPQVYDVLNDDLRLVLLIDEFDILDQNERGRLATSNPGAELHSFLRRVTGGESQLAFIFAMGQRIENLSLNAKITFKASQQREIGMLDPASARAVVRQAETNDSLRFTEESVEHILHLTDGHPYLTQLLCQCIWKQAYRRPQQSIPPVIEVPDAETAVEEALETGDNSLVWIWESLIPAERVYAAAMGEVATEGESISVDSVINIIVGHSPERRSREVEQAPDGLVRRHVLREVGSDHYQFTIELFRRWVRVRKTLRAVEDELDRLRPDAEAFFVSGKEMVDNKRWRDAHDLFSRTLEINPQHLGARLLLGESLLALNRPAQAVDELEGAYRLNPRKARLPLVRALVKRAEGLVPTDEDQALAICERALGLSPTESFALKMQSEIRARRGDDLTDTKEIN
ncbi:MAG: tetratricopeptide repeat protein [bacterium]|nr:tetratricopeptide repeat protein [bacterium]